MTKLFANELWSDAVDLLALPGYVFTQGSPALTRSELAVFAIACKVTNNPKANCRFAIKLEEMQKLTGYGDKQTVSDALRGLCEKKFIKKVKTARRKTDPFVYEVCDPETSEGFSTDSGDERNTMKLRRALKIRNYPYFWLPTVAVKQLPTVKSSSFALFVAVARQASLRGRTFEIPTAELEKFSGLEDRRTLKAAMTEIHQRWVFMGFTDSSSKTVHVNLIDPANGSFIGTEELERELKEQAERHQRFKEHKAKNRKHTPVQILAWAMWNFSSELKPSTIGEFKTFCPSCHNRSTHKPNLSINPFKAQHGVYCCGDCGVGGNLLDLIAQRVGLVEALTMLQGIERAVPRLVQKAEQMLKGTDADGKYTLAAA
jgi:hypothetical protein